MEPDRAPGDIHPHRDMLPADRLHAPEAIATHPGVGRGVRLHPLTDLELRGRSHIDILARSGDGRGLRRTTALPANGTSRQMAARPRPVPAQVPGSRVDLSGTTGVGGRPPAARGRKNDRRWWRP